MATNRWVGGAPVVAKIWYFVPGTVSIGNTFTITINSKSVTYTAAAATVADVTSGLAALCSNAAAPPEFRDITWSDQTTYLLATAKTPGTPFTITSVAVSDLRALATFTSLATLATPTNASFADVSTGGTLNANTAYWYRVAAYNAAGTTLASTETSLTTANDGNNTHQVTVNWNRVPGASGYRIFGRATGAELFIAAVTGEGTLTYNDTGSITPIGALPGANTTAQNGQGPNDANVAVNWSLGAVPVATNDIVFESNSIDCLWNLDAFVGVTPNSVRQESSMTGRIGLPQYNSGGYAEYRQQYFQFLGVTTTAKIGTPGPLIQGGNNTRTKWDFRGTAAAITVYQTGAPGGDGQGIEACLLVGTNASNTIEILSGSVGVAVLSGETANVSGGFIVGGNAVVRCGSGVTFGSITQSGTSTITTNSAITTVNQTSGNSQTTCKMYAMSGNITTVNLNGGYFSYQGTGTITTINGRRGGVADFTVDGNSRTVTTVNVYEGFNFNDELKTLGTGTNYVFNCPFSKATINVGDSFTMQRTV